MAKPVTKKKIAGKQKKEMYFPFGKENFIIIAIGIIDIIIGYIILAKDSLNGSGAMVIAPILLVVGYCVIIPYGILKRPKIEIENSQVIEAIPAPAATAKSSFSSNIKTG